MAILHHCRPAQGAKAFRRVVNGCYLILSDIDNSWINYYSITIPSYLDEWKELRILDYPRLLRVINLQMLQATSVEKPRILKGPFGIGCGTTPMWWRSTWPAAISGNVQESPALDPWKW